jgi:hypothetical protein
MKNRVLFLTTAAVITTLLLSPAARANEEAEKEAVAAAETWLTLIDQGDIAKSWETAAALAKGAITQEQWVQALGAVRGPLGKLTSREVSSSKFTSTLPGAPDGEYVVIKFKTSFENKASAIETVTPMKDPDGEWRVSGYFIK